MIFGAIISLVSRSNRLKAVMCQGIWTDFVAQGDFDQLYSLSLTLSAENSQNDVRAR